MNTLLIIAFGVLLALAAWSALKAGS
jgi:hypothetical protein